jgi:hypothetical protein
LKIKRSRSKNYWGAILDKIKKIFNKFNIVLIIIIIACVGIRIYYGNQKEGYHIDELYSYTLMNVKGGFLINIPNFSSEWKTKADIIDSLTINKGEALNYKMVYQNQTHDVHPPIYYFLLNTAASFTPNYFTKWSGITLNIVISIISIIMVYIISKELLNDKKWSLLLALLYGFSSSAISLTVFIRMYELFSLNVLLFIYINMLLIMKKEINKKHMILLTATTILGLLTHYYFLFFAASFSILCMIKFLFIEKNHNKTFVYISSLLLGGIISILLYPAFLLHVFKSNRGIEAMSNLFNFSRYIDNLKTAYKITNSHLFYNYFIVLIIIILYLLLLALFKEIKINYRDLSLPVLMLLSSVLYIFIVMKVAPYIELRYISPVLGVILISIILLLKVLIDGLTNNKSFIFILIIFSIITLLNIKSNNIEFLYKDILSKETKLNEIVEKGTNTCIVFAKTEWAITDQIFNYKKFDYIHFRMAPTLREGLLEKDNKKVNDFVLYIEKEYDSDKILGELYNKNYESYKIMETRFSNLYHVYLSE